MYALFSTLIYITFIEDDLFFSHQFRLFNNLVLLCIGFIIQNNSVPDVVFPENKDNMLALRIWLNGEGDKLWPMKHGIGLESMFKGCLEKIVVVQLIL
jgi:hypothetical protein